MNNQIFCYQILYHCHHVVNQLPTNFLPQIQEKDEKPPAVSDTDTTTETTEPDPTAYKQLEVNTKLDNDKDWVGILHKAIHTFTGEKAGDLCFNEGDMVTVYQVLENDWWLGSKDDVVGWFPRSYVEVSSAMNLAKKKHTMKNTPE